MSGDAKWTIGIILPTMIALFILSGGFMNARINDVQADIQSLQADMREIRTLLLNHVTDYEIHQPPE